MRPRRQGIATYLQTFILIAVALGGSLVAYREVSAYASSAGGPAIQVSGASLRQGAGVTIERLAISNSGTSVFHFINILNPNLAPGARYCYTVASISGEAQGGTCPSMNPNPTSVEIDSNLTSGSTIVITIILEGSGVSQGRAYPLLVMAPGASVVSEQMVASPG